MVSIFYCVIVQPNSKDVFTPNKVFPCTDFVLKLVTVVKQRPTFAKGAIKMVGHQARFRDKVHCRPTLGARGFVFCCGGEEPDVMEP